jgi:hypothetical protein
MQVTNGISEGGIIEGSRLIGPQRIHIEAEEDLGAHGIADLEARLGGWIRGKNQKQAAIKRFGALGPRERNREAIRSSLLRVCSDSDRKDCDQD